MVSNNEIELNPKIGISKNTLILTCAKFKNVKIFSCKESFV